MSRPTERTRLFSLDDAKRIVDLFGSIPNASRLLGEPLPEAEMRRALSFKPITPADNDKLRKAWDRWCRYFGLRNDVVDYRWATMENPGRHVLDPVHPRDALVEQAERREAE